MTKNKYLPDKCKLNGAVTHKRPGDRLFNAKRANTCLGVALYVASLAFIQASCMLLPSDKLLLLLKLVAAAGVLCFIAAYVIGYFAEDFLRAAVN
jgi:hypothetical protein